MCDPGAYILERRPRCRSALPRCRRRAVRRCRPRRTMRFPARPPPQSRWPALHRRAVHLRAAAPVIAAFALPGPAEPRPRWRYPADQHDRLLCRLGAHVTGRSSISIPRNSWVRASATPRAWEDSPTAMSCVKGPIVCPREFYIARVYLRFMLPLGPQLAKFDAAQDQIGGTEAATRSSQGRLVAVNDDFDKNRYAANTRTEFMNWSLWDNTAWDYAADTRGYTAGFVLGYMSPLWSLKFGEYLHAASAPTARSSRPPSGARTEINLELTLAPAALRHDGAAARLLKTPRAWAFIRRRSRSRPRAARNPTSSRTMRTGRKKYGFGLNIEQPLADDGATGVFARLGWNNGKTESFAFTEVDRLASFGGETIRQPLGTRRRRRSARRWRSRASPPGTANTLPPAARFSARRRAPELRARSRLSKPTTGCSCPWQWARLQLSPDISSSGIRASMPLAARCGSSGCAFTPSISGPPNCSCDN